MQVSGGLHEVSELSVAFRLFRTAVHYVLRLTREAMQAQRAAEEAAARRRELWAAARQVWACVHEPGCSPFSAGLVPDGMTSSIFAA